jgi:hypothetical protein
MRPWSKTRTASRPLSLTDKAYFQVEKGAGSKTRLSCFFGGQPDWRNSAGEANGTSCGSLRSAKYSISMQKMEGVLDLARMSLIALLLGSTVLSGCGLIAAGAAGGVAGSELSEDDDDFDPLENTEVGQEVDEQSEELMEDLEE